MSGVWVFKDGIVRRVEKDNPGGSSSNSGSMGRPKVLVHVPSGEVVLSYDILERRLQELGWERFKLVHMYDIVVKTRNVFEVRDA
ncbi:hypothetical protein BRADI_3g12450v3 [Brachypodium distachyon]|uniref:Flowering-promoting factor 1-like protein 3 n=1 Tax=Brachypodium distachyon TaxID=15368 RepID=I1I013_BRADI|nr:hypothetical protein BRADI_3g12450v3 [Brachypodium distachyon]